MIGFSKVKINLGLNVVAKRPDGYHNLESIFLTLPLGDVIEILPSTVGDQHFSLQVSGIGAKQLISENIVEKAWRILHRDFGIAGVDTYLHKIIPSGAGLGGGSSDGVSMLKLLNEFFQLQLNAESLERYALELGSDCPFFVKEGCSFVEGRGEVLSSVNLDLSQYHFLIVHSGVHSSTKEAFSGIKPSRPQQNVLEIIKNVGIESWSEVLVNDFESSIFPLYPELARIKQKLYENGSLYAAMSGSGSAIYGIFSERKEIQFPEHYFVRWCTTSAPF